MTPTRLLQIADNSELLGAKADARDLRAMAEKMSEKGDGDLVERVLDELDDIETAQGMCLWSHVANAKTLMKLRLREAMSDYCDGLTALLRAQLAAAEADRQIAEDALKVAMIHRTAAEAQLAIATKALESAQMEMRRLAQYPKAGSSAEDAPHMAQIASEALIELDKALRSLKPDGGEK